MQDLEFKLKPSVYYLVFLSSVFLMSVPIILCLPLHFAIKSLILVSVCLYGAAIFWKFGLLRSGDSIISMRRQSGGRWLLASKKKVVSTELCGDSTVTPFVSVLRFRQPQSWRRISCVIFRDSLGSLPYRHLLTQLRMN